MGNCMCINHEKEYYRVAGNGCKQSSEGKQECCQISRVGKNSHEDRRARNYPSGVDDRGWRTTSNKNCSKVKSAAVNLKQYLF